MPGIKHPMRKPLRSFEPASPAAIKTEFRNIFDEAPSNKHTNTNCSPGDTRVAEALLTPAKNLSKSNVDAICVKACLELIPSYTLFGGLSDVFTLNIVSGCDTFTVFASM